MFRKKLESYFSFPFRLSFLAPNVLGMKILGFTNRKNIDTNATDSCNLVPSLFCRFCCKIIESLVIVISEELPVTSVDIIIENAKTKNRNGC